jgi:GT2 family glycosyltransferase
VDDLPFVSVVTLNYNGKTYLGNLLDDCIASVLRSKYSNLELLFVDNGSKDQSTDYIVDKFGGDSRVRVIRLGKNYGTSRGHNAAIKQSKGDLILLLNNDTWVPENAIGRMVEVSQLDKKVAAVTCRIISPNGQTQTEGFKFGRFFRVFGYFLSSEPLADTRADVYWKVPGVKIVDWAAGAALMVKREAFDKVGLQDEDYYTYNEDLDWCYRAKEKGFVVLCVTDAEIVHYGGITAGHYPGWKADLMARNKLLFILKHLSAPTVLIAFLINFFDAARLLALGFLKLDRFKLREAKSKIMAYTYVRRPPIVPG